MLKVEEKEKLYNIVIYITKIETEGEKERNKKLRT